MTTTQALYVLEVAACRSMSRAAQRLYVSQSAISQQIQKLEQELGCALFTRTAAGPELTAAEASVLFYYRGAGGSFTREIVFQIADAAE